MVSSRAEECMTIGAGEQETITVRTAKGSSIIGRSTRFVP